MAWAAVWPTLTTSPVTETCWVGISPGGVDTEGSSCTNTAAIDGVLAFLTEGEALHKFSFLPSSEFTGIIVISID